MKNYRMVDTWEIEESYTQTEQELLKMAYDLVCNTYSDEEMREVKARFDHDIPGTIAFIEKECGWRAEII